MLHFASAGVRTKPPEELSWSEKGALLVTGINLPRPVNTRTPADAFTTHHLQTTDGLNIEAWWVPAANARAAVVLFHGYGGSKSELLDEAEAFRRLGCDTFLVDHRGHGGSAGTYTSIGFLEAEDVAAAVAYLRSNLAPHSPVILFGASMGAVSVLRSLATHELPVSGVVIESVYDTMLNAVRNRFHSMGLPAFPFSEALGFWGGVQMGFPCWQHNPADYAAAVRVPVLMLHGEADPRATLEQAQAVLAKLPRSSQLVVFPGLKHQSLERGAPETWNQAVGAYVAHVAPTP
ncbi:MAG TPA: alpha/beta hydrolase [Candidatus Limnocylindrales bacterium]|nr:alpha/beta hydrolase [Candidatus Limnocylindrales bacterium]